MAKVCLAGVTRKFRAKNLYCDGKAIDKGVALENLKLFSNFAAKENIKHTLMFGSALGVVREKDFIAHDEDTDIAVYGGDFEKVWQKLDILLESGFKIARYDARGHFSLIRKGEYIDIMQLNREEDTFIACGMYIYPAELLDSVKLEDFLGLTVFIPARAEDVLKYEYGETWLTPIKYRIKKTDIFKSKLKGLIKAVLPQKVRQRIVTALGRGIRKDYLSRLDAYRKKGAK